MTQATCTVLAGIFPVVLLTMAVEARLVTARARRSRFFRSVVTTGLSGSLLGLTLSVVGVEVDGWGAPVGVLVWSAAGIASLALAVLLMLIVVSDEVELERHDD